MSAIELLEDRIASLEKQVYGLGKTTRINDNVSENTVIDNLLHANTLISSALSGREKANVVIKRLPELNSYLDPVFENSEIPTDAKLQLLLAMEPEIKENHKLLNQIQELASVLEIKQLRDIPELTHKLSNLSLLYLNAYEESEELSSHINEVFSKYNEVITSISKTLIALDTAVTTAEIAAKPKKQLD